MFVCLFGGEQTRVPFVRVRARKHPLSPTMHKQFALQEKARQDHFRQKLNKILETDDVISDYPFPFFFPRQPGMHY